ncbi:MAG: transglutaminase domain-containing protein [Eubacterium sp.]|nr:transglutaminase domain-containing protein [Eubacterium sp.]
MRSTKPIRLLPVLIILLLLCLTGCGKEDSAPQAGTPEETLKAGSQEMSQDAKADKSEDSEKKVENPYQAPDLALTKFHSDKAEGDSTASIDLSAADQGYVGVSAVSDQRLKFQVLMDDSTYNYDLKGDGTPCFYPLQCGDGSYRFRIMENVIDSKYAELFSTSCDVTIKDQFQPFIRPSEYVSYGPDDACVKVAQKLASRSEDALGVVHEIYDYVCDNVSYDKEKAKDVKVGYLPDPDETLSSGKGICFDYASLAAAMLRSQGIPTKVIFGYVSPNDLYHAWNMFYTEETGWVTVDYEVTGDDWNRLDLTFAANGADGDFIGDGSNYTDVYCY